ncbi:hypothetical protein D9M68_805370 [compost metagenome]
MSSYAYGIISFLINIAFAVFFCLDMRKKAGGYWTFGEALWKIFVMFLLSAAILYIFTILFGKYIDTTYPVKMKELVSEKTESMLKSLGMDEGAMEEAMAKNSEQLEKQFNPDFFQAVIALGITAVMYFIGALIFALIFKKNNPNGPWAAVDENVAKEQEEN